MILVAGATGVTGGRVVHKLLAKGVPVRALVRESSDHAALVEAGAEIAFADLKEPLSIRKAMEGVTRVVSTATASSRGGDDTIESVDRIGTASLIEASRESGVERFVFVSAWGFKKDMGIAIARAKVENEERLQESGVPYTILYPVLFMDVWIGWVIGSQLQHGDQVRILGGKDARYGFIAAENVADVAVAALGEPRAENAKITLCAEVATFPDVVKKIAKATGRSLEVEAVEPKEFEGLPPMVIELWGKMSALEPPEPTDEVFASFGVRPVGLDDFLPQAFRPATAGAV